MLIFQKHLKNALLDRRRIGFFEAICLANTSFSLFPNQRDVLLKPLKLDSEEEILRQDWEAICGDWEHVGGYLWHGVNTVKEEIDEAGSVRQGKQMVKNASKKRHSKSSSSFRATAEKNPNQDVDVQSNRREKLAPQGRISISESPFPAPEMFEDYQRAGPGSAERIIEFTEREQKHRHKLDGDLSELNITVVKKGQRMAFCIACMVLGVSAYAVHLGYAWQAVTLISASGGMVVAYLQK